MSEKDNERVHGSENVFRDLGGPQADIEHARAVLAAQIIAVLDDRGFAVRKAASLTGFAVAGFSRIRSADLGHFTLDRLMKRWALWTPTPGSPSKPTVSAGPGLRVESPQTTRRLSAGVEGSGVLPEGRPDAPNLPANSTVAKWAAHSG